MNFADLYISYAFNAPNFTILHVNDSMLSRVDAKM